MRVGGRESGSSQHSIFMQYQRRAEKKGRALSTRSLGRASTGSTYIGQVWGRMCACVCVCVCVCVGGGGGGGDH